MEEAKRYANPLELYLLDTCTYKWQKIIIDTEVACSGPYYREHYRLIRVIFVSIASEVFRHGIVGIIILLAIVNIDFLDGWESFNCGRKWIVPYRYSFTLWIYKLLFIYIYYFVWNRNIIFTVWVQNKQRT